MKLITWVVKSVWIKIGSSPSVVVPPANILQGTRVSIEDNLLFLVFSSFKQEGFQSDHFFLRSVMLGHE